jgi:hypothetical protein
VRVGLARTLPAGATELGKGRPGVWFAASDEVLLAALATGAKLLYLSRPEYDQAVRGLAPDELAPAVAKRAERLGDKLPGLAESLLAGRKQQILPLARGNPAHFERSLNLLTRLTTAGSFDDYPEDDRIDRLYDRAWGFLAELDTPEAAPHVLPEEAELHRGFADAYAASLRRRGRADYGRLPLRVTIERGWFVAPPEPGLVAAWKLDGIPAIAWDGGVVGPIATHDVDEVRAHVQTAQLLYPSWQTPIAAALALTPPQLALALAEQRAKPDHGLAAHLDALRVEQTLVRRAVLASLKTPELVALLTAHVAAELPNLRRPPPPPGLVEAERALLADADLLQRAVALAPIEWSTVALRLASVRQTIADDLEKL